MFGLTIRTKSAEGSAPLHTRLKVEGKSLWVNLRLMVDIQEWNKRKDTERKMVNYLMSLGHMDKLNAIELGVKDLRLRHRLTVQNLENLIENVVLADTREKHIEAEQLKKDISPSENPSHPYWGLLSNIFLFSMNILFTISGATCLNVTKNCPISWFSSDFGDFFTFHCSPHIIYESKWK